MCGRFTLSLDSEQIQKAFPWVAIPDNISPRYNIAPNQPVGVLPNDGTNRLDFYLWGLIPFWVKDISSAKRLINARAETLAEKPSFRSSFLRRRCLILANGFFEWQLQPDGKTKYPMLVRLRSGLAFGFAGLWDVWQSPDGSEIKSCTIITTQPNELMRPIHDRMPVIIDPQNYSNWLDSNERRPETLNSFLQPFPPENMEAARVSSLVNNPKIDAPECIEVVDHSSWR